MTAPALLGIQATGGFTPEARVFAGLLAHRDDRYGATVIHHEWSGDRTSARQFAAAAHLPVDTLDLAWRWRPPGVERVLVQLLARVRLRRVLPRVVERARSSGASIVYSNQQRWDSQIAAHVATRAGLPRITHLHYNVGPWLGAGALQRLLASDHIITVSDFIRGQVLEHGVASARVTTLRNTMAVPPPAQAGTRDAVRRELALPLDATVIGSVARLDFYKGQQDAIPAFARISASLPAAWLLLVGDGDNRAELEAQASSAGVRSKVVFAGHRDDSPRMRAAIDIFVHPARADPCPLGVLEASADGLPVVAYAHGGVPELVESGVSGLLVEVDDIEALAGAMSALTVDAARGRAMGAAGRQRVAERFRAPDAGSAFAGILEGVAREPAVLARRGGD